MSYKYHIQTAFSALLLQCTILTSCVDMDYFTSDSRPIRLEVANQTEETRAGTNIQGDSFLGDEIVNVYIKGKSNDFDEYVIGAPLKCRTGAPSDGKNALEPIGDTPYFPTGTGSEASIYATYPDFVTSDMTSFVVESDQQSDANYKKSDLMAVSPFTQTKTSNIVPLPFTHKMAKMIILASAGDNCSVDNYITLSGIKTAIAINPSEANIIDPDGDGNYNVSFPADNPYGEITMTNGGAVLFPPQIVTADKFITVTGTYKDKQGVTHTNASASFDISEKTFEAGKVYTLNLAIGADNFITDVDIVGWLSEYGEITMTPSGGYDGVTIDEIPSRVYTGSAIEPEPVVHYGTVNPKDLVLNSDYTFKYVDNVDVGRAQVLVLGKNYYAGMAAVQSFYITQKTGSISFPADANSLATVGYTIGGKIENVKVNNTGDGKVTYSSGKPSVATVDAESGVVSIWNEGTAVITATVTDGRNYTYPEGSNSASYTVTVNQRSASVLQVDYEPTSFTYDGTEHQLTSVTVSDNGNTLAYGTDYTYTFTNNENVGNAKLTIIGQGNYSNETTKEINIPINKATPTVTVSPDDLWIGIHSSSAPENRRKTRKATTQSWAEATLEYSSSDETVVKVNKTTGQLIGQPLTSAQENDDNYQIREATIYVDVKSTDNYNAAERKSFKVHVVKSDFNFAYTGDTQEWTCPATGVWQLDCYGAQGASTPAKGWYWEPKPSTNPVGWTGSGNTDFPNRGTGGKGAHVAGKLRLIKGTKLYVNVGQQGRNAMPKDTRSDTQVRNYYTGSDQSKYDYSNDQFELFRYAWNGGANFVWGMRGGGGVATSPYNTASTTNVIKYPISGGGGATDISLDWGAWPRKSNMVDYENEPSNWYDWKSSAHLYSRIIVAGGGGGALHYRGEGDGYADGGEGGAWEGGNGKVIPGGSDYGQGGKLNRGGYGGVTGNTQYNSNATTLWYEYGYFKAYDNRRGGWSCTDGIFGEGGYFTLAGEGNGNGGGGWYGGGAGGQNGSNSSGGGGSSYLWCSNLAEYYPSGKSSLVTEAFYMTQVTAEAGANAGNGKATIRVVSLEDTNPNQ